VREKQIVVEERGKQPRERESESFLGEFEELAGGGEKFLKRYLVVCHPRKDLAKSVTRRSRKWKKKKREETNELVDEQTKNVALLFGLVSKEVR